LAPAFADPSKFEMIPTRSARSPPHFLRRRVQSRGPPLPNHDPVGYINDGYDEVQVYWSIDTLFESLHAMGFEDPELSTRPFNAFLYDPDIESRA